MWPPIWFFRSHVNNTRLINLIVTSLLDLFICLYMPFYEINKFVSLRSSDRYMAPWRDIIVVIRTFTVGMSPQCATLTLNVLVSEFSGISVGHSFSSCSVKSVSTTSSFSEMLLNVTTLWQQLAPQPVPSSSP